MVIWLLSGLGTAYAQETAAIDASELPGIVIDQYGRPVKGVEISIKKSDFKTVSSEDGTFNFDAIPGTTLVFSHPDYLLKEIKVPINISQKKAFKVDLKDKKIKNPDTIELPYRGAVDKDSYLGAASTIYSGQIESTLSANLLGTMTGRMSGLNITQTRGYRQMRLQSSASTNTFLGSMAEVGRGNYGDNTQFSYLLRGATSPVVIVD
jgi:hypothetical protein